MSFDHELAGRLTLYAALRRVELIQTADKQAQRTPAASGGPDKAWGTAYD